MMYPRLYLGRNLLREDDVGAFLSLAHRCFERECLLESHPCVIGVSTILRSLPKDRDIDAAVGAAGGEVRGKQPETGASCGLPRLNPNGPAGLKFRDD